MTILLNASKTVQTEPMFPGSLASHASLRVNYNTVVNVLKRKIALPIISITKKQVNALHALLIAPAAHHLK